MNSTRTNPIARLTGRNKTTDTPNMTDEATVASEVSQLNSAAEAEEVPVYGQLKTSIVTPTDGSEADQGFDGSLVDLSKSPFPIKNDVFDGQVHMLLRDLPGNTYDFDGDKDVLWEIQIQGKFRRMLKGPVYFALELPQNEKYKVTGPMKLVIKASLQLMKTMGHKDVHVSFGGNGEVPHMGAPAFHSFDRVVVTPEGETPPKLGEYLPKMPSDVQRRKNFFKTGMMLDLNSTYTFSVKNRRFDPLKWKVIGVPIVRQFTVSRFTNSCRLAVYELLEEDDKPVADPKGSLLTMAKKKHTKKNTFIWVRMSRNVDEAEKK